MRISVIPVDRTIVVNGVAVQLPADVPFPATDPEIEAIQWQGDAMHGTYQRKSGTEPFNDPAVVTVYLDAFHAELERRLEAQRVSYNRMKSANADSHANQIALWRKLLLDL